MRSPDKQEGFLQDEFLAENTRVGPFQRLLFAFIGLLAGVAALLLFMLQTVQWDMFVLYALFSSVGWALVGLPVILLFPACLLSRLTWPVCLLIGATLGPLALLLILAVLYGLQGRLSTFSLARTETLWPLSILVSTVSFVVYAALLRRRFRTKEQ